MHRLMQNIIRLRSFSTTKNLFGKLRLQSSLYRPQYQVSNLKNCQSFTMKIQPNERFILSYFYSFKKTLFLYFLLFYQIVIYKLSIIKFVLSSKIQKSLMIREIVQSLPKYKDSIHYQGIKDIISRLITKLTDEKNVSQQKKQNYLRSFKELDWSLSKVTANWPEQIQHKVDQLKNNLMSFETQLNQISKGSSLFCGSGGNPKQLEKIHKNILTFENFFYAIGVYQTKQSREKIVEQVLQRVQKDRSTTSKFTATKKQVEQPPKKQEQKPPQTMCQYCQLMIACSLCPNGYVAKKLVKQLPDTEWIAGILYEQGTVVDKNLQKAIIFYQQARKKKHPEAMYRLGSLNQRGLYGKPNEYIQIWEESCKLGHLQSLTDMGYLYENGLYDEDTDKEILAPNEEKALKYYLKAAEKNFPRALNNLATFYYNSKKYSNQNKCLEFLERAAEAQYVKSLHNLALVYIQGTMGNTDETKGMNLLKRAAQKGDIEARILYIERMLNEAARCSEDDFMQLHKYCRELIAKDEQLPEPYYFLGIMYENGYAVPSKPKIAILYYSVAAEYRSEAAFLKLGDCYKNGFGIQQDSKQAIRCYEQVAKTNPLALVYLGQIFQQGSHDLKVNNERAFQYYYEACNHNIPQAFNRLGNMYKYGKHVNKNEAKAQQYYEKGRALERKNVSKMNASSSELLQSSYYRRR